MARQPEAVTELHREVGAALAAYLEASPLSQGDLARVTNYHRTSISHIQAGRQFPEREFWEKADTALSAGGALVAQDVGIIRSRLAELRLTAALDIIEGGNAPATVRDLASAARSRLTSAA